MNNEVKYILQDCLLALFVLMVCNAAKFFYNSSDKEGSTINNNAVVADDDGVNIRPVIPDLALRDINYSKTTVLHVTPLINAW